MTEPNEQGGEFLYYLNYFPKGEPEFLSSNGAISLNSYMSSLSGNVSMTLADGVRASMNKLILTQGGANATITCSLDQTVDDWVSISLGANNKVHFVWNKREGWWAIVDGKGLTKNL